VKCEAIEPDGIFGYAELKVHFLRKFLIKDLKDLKDF